jgi:predicted transglutaminase-like cysteine proteinase
LAWGIDRVSTALTPSKTSSIMTKLSGTRQEKAVADFKKELNSRATSLVKSARFARMTDEDKAKALKKVREEVNKDIKKKYGIK